MFIAALFTITKNWKQPRYSTTEEWINNPVYTYNRILCSNKREKNTVSCNSIDEHGERNQTQKMIYFMVPFIQHSGKGEGEQQWLPGFVEGRAVNYKGTA